MDKALRDELNEMASRNKTDKADHCHDYMGAYAEQFEDLRNKKIKLVEIGVSSGDSLRTWREFFPNAEIYGVEIEPSVLESPTAKQFKLFIGDQRDTKFLQSVVDEIGQPDIIIDDGGHTMLQQIESFEFLFPHLKAGGIYAIEDLHTSYTKGYLDGNETCIEYLQRLVMAPNFNGHPQDGSGGYGSKAIHCQKKGYTPTYYESAVRSLHFYRSVAFVTKEAE